jgi:prepilin peptidase CpaA
LTPEHALWTVLAVALVICTVTDVLWRRVLDLVTLPAIALGLLLRVCFEGLGGVETGLLSGLIGLGACAAIFALLALRKKMGWGDVKLMAAVGACFGYPSSLAALVFVSLAGALQALVTLIWQGAVWETLANVGKRWAVRVKRLPQEAAGETRRIPYGVSIALGSFWAMWWQHTNVR